MSRKPNKFGVVPSASSKYRRNTTVTGEDLPALKKIAKEIKGQNLTVEDFILLVGPHTGDKGAALTNVMNKDLTAFRRMVTKVYNTMTKDASDVMANTQIELAQLYSEKQRILVDKMIRSLQTIKDYVPEFDFQRYFQDPESYLTSLFGIAEIPDDEEIETARRQLAYHRLQWLQSEGERLQAENTKLEERLVELKKVKRKQIIETIKKENEVENTKAELEQKQEEMQNELEELADKLHDTIISEEKRTMDTKKERNIKILSKKPKTAEAVVMRSQRGTDSEEWNVRVAAEYSKAQIQGDTVTNFEMKSQSASATSAKARLRKAPNKSSLIRRPRRPIPIDKRPAWQDVNLDEFVLGGEALRDTPSQIAQQAIPQRQPASCPSTSCTGRRVAGPRNTWGGFR